MQSTQVHTGLDVIKDALQKGVPIIHRGLEKEGLRATESGQIAQSDHPKVLGHPLTHSHITTDYSEALLELITDVHSSRENLLQELKDVHTFVQANLDTEVLWSGSMPCGLFGEQSVRIAEYGDSNIGQLKHTYRQGLGVRYGRTMQSIAGLHFNFSLDEQLWMALHEAANTEINLQDFKSEQYFALIRNFRRYAWLLMYLFGASPVLDQSFADAYPNHDLESFDDQGTLHKPYACSLRMSDMGYHNNAQAGLNICFNTLENFTSTLGQAVKTPYQPYIDIGMFQGDQAIQLNGNILQIENEYYSSIRPKRSTQSGEKPTRALEERGVEYVEVRCLDLDPTQPLGISAEQIDFMDLFLLKCLFDPSDYLSNADCTAVEENFKLVVDQGRKPGLKLTDSNKQKTLQEWGTELLDSMKSIAETLDTNGKAQDQRYTKALASQMEKLKNVELTPSARVIQSMQSEQKSWLQWANSVSRTHQKQLVEDCSQSADCVKSSEAYAQEASTSLQKAEQIKASDTTNFLDFLNSYNDS